MFFRLLWIPNGIKELVDKHMGTFGTLDWASYQVNWVYCGRVYFTILHYYFFLLFWKPSRAYINPTSQCISFILSILKLNAVKVIYSPEVKMGHDSLRYVVFRVKRAGDGVWSLRKTGLLSLNYIHTGSMI